MKKIALFLMIILLSGCAQHDEDGNIMYDDEGNEQIDGWKTAGLVAGIAVATTGVVLMARNSLDILPALKDEDSSSFTVK